MRLTNNGVVFTSGTITVGLSSSVELSIQGGAVEAAFELAEGESVTFSLQLLDADAQECAPPLNTGEEQALFQTTVDRSTTFRFSHSSKNAVAAAGCGPVG